MFNQDRGDESSVFHFTGRALRAFFRVYESLRTFDPEVRDRNQRYSSDVGPDGLALPPDALRVRVAGTADIESLSSWRSTCRSSRSRVACRLRKADRRLPSHPGLRVRVWPCAAPVERSHSDCPMRHGSGCRTGSVVRGPPPVRAGVGEFRRAADEFRR